MQRTWRIVCWYVYRGTQGALCKILARAHRCRACRDWGYIAVSGRWHWQPAAVNVKKIVDEKNSWNHQSLGSLFIPEPAGVGRGKVRAPTKSELYLIHLCKASSTCARPHPPVQDLTHPVRCYQSYKIIASYTVQHGSDKLGYNIKFDVCRLCNNNTYWLTGQWNIFSVRCISLLHWCTPLLQ